MLVTESTTPHAVAAMSELAARPRANSLSQIQADAWSRRDARISEINAQWSARLDGATKPPPAKAVEWPAEWPSRRAPPAAVEPRGPLRVYLGDALVAAGPGVGLDLGPGVRARPARELAHRCDGVRRGVLTVSAVCCSAARIRAVVRRFCNLGPRLRQRVSCRWPQLKRCVRSSAVVPLPNTLSSLPSLAKRNCRRWTGASLAKQAAA